jgi:hypothetical protein
MNPIIFTHPAQKKTACGLANQLCEEHEVRFIEAIQPLDPGIQLSAQPLLAMSVVKFLNVSEAELF